MSARVPEVVASLERLRTTATIPATVVFTPSSDGLFRVTLYVEIDVFSPDVGSLVLPQMTWTNPSATPAGAFSMPIPADSSANATRGSDITTRMVAGGPVSISVAFSGVTTPPTYSLNAVVERL